MNETPKSPEETAPAVPPPSRPQKSQGWGAIIAVIIIVVMVCVGAYYAWTTRSSAQYQPSGQYTGA